MKADPIDLVNAHIDGRQLSEEEARYLSDWVRADAKNARMIVELGLIHTQVEYLVSIPKFLKELEDSEQAWEVGQLQKHSESSPTQSSNSLRSTLWNRKGALFAAAAVLLVVVAAGRTALKQNPSRLDTPEDSANRMLVSEQQLAESTHDKPAIAQSVLATVTESLGTIWTRSEEPRRGLHIRRDETVELKEGILLLTTALGSEVVVQAPATFRFRTKDRIELDSGRLTARVEGVPTGLTVTTPTAKIVDLGTEFGVGVGQESDTVVAVCDGAVELSGRNSTNQSESSVQLVTAGRSGYVGSDGTLRWIVKTLQHDRDFIRPDEIASLRQAGAGSLLARQKLAYFGLQRTEGLLGFQSFDIPSLGTAYTHGFQKQPIRSSRTVSFAEDLVESHLYSSGSLHLSEGESVFLDLDTSINSTFAHAGLLTDQGKIGRSGTQVWMTWKSRSLQPDRSADHVGLSLMFGDARLRQEPIFIGTADRKSRFSLVSHIGSRVSRAPLDADSTSFSIDPVIPGDGVNQWVARIIFSQRADKVSIWYDVPINEISQHRPHAELNTTIVNFDRIKLEVGRNSGPWRFDDIMLATDLEAIATAIQYQRD